MSIAGNFGEHLFGRVDRLIDHFLCVRGGYEKCLELAARHVDALADHAPKGGALRLKSRAFYHGSSRNAESVR